nr:helix-turn-helix transcriptional regulator [Nitrospirota bacterium]
MTIWGKIIESLRSQRGISQGDLARGLIVGKDAYYRICRSKRGPTILTLNALLMGMHCTWHDWAHAYDALARLQGDALSTAHPRPKSPSLHRGKRATHKSDRRT